MASKDPAVLFYTSDFLSGVSLMTMKERGQYITLLCLQRERGHLLSQEITKAVGHLSEEVLSKFEQDEDGKFFNARMDKEVRKREEHCRKQKENILKRWNKPNDGVGNVSGNTVVHTTVLPLGNGNGNDAPVIFTYQDRKNLGTEDEGTFTPQPPSQGPDDPGRTAVCEYLDRINPSASPASLDELRGYAESMGAAVCGRAMDIALDNKSPRWPYIRAILRDKQSRGVRCIADWDALEEKREAKSDGSGRNIRENSGKKWDVPGSIDLE